MTKYMTYKKQIKDIHNQEDLAYFMDCLYYDQEIYGNKYRMLRRFALKHYHENVEPFEPMS